VQDQTLNKCRDLLALTHLKRWNVVPLTREQSVAEHSHRVAVIAMAIVERFEQLDDTGNYTGMFDLGRILRWALVHDGPECLTGDLPSGVKRLLGTGPIQDMEDQLCPWFSDEEALININDELIVKIADLIEANSWLALHGTTASFPVRSELIDRISELQMQGVSMLGEAFYKATHEVWEQAVSGQIPTWTPWRKNASVGTED
jgi:hypothetical protein